MISPNCVLASVNRLHLNSKSNEALNKGGVRCMSRLDKHRRLWSSFIQFRVLRPTYYLGTKHFLLGISTIVKMHKCIYFKPKSL